MAELKITAGNFNAEVIGSELPVLLDFWASWCGPCRMLGPFISELAEEYDGKMKVGKVNVDDEPELAGRFGVSSIPTVVLIKDGRVVAASIGYKPKEELVKALGI